tara:strand:- start:2562 stop:2801 length:240 start_codon:yes stop_codon:yes gene_type:complete
MRDNYPPGMTAADHDYLDGNINCNHEDGFTIVKLEEIVTDKESAFVCFEVTCDVCGETGYVTYDLVVDSNGDTEHQLEW